MQIAVQAPPSRRRSLDILGSYRGDDTGGTRKCRVVLNGVSYRDQRLFTVALTLNEDKISDAYSRFIKTYVQSIEKKYRIDLDTNTKL